MKRMRDFFANERVQAEVDMRVHGLFKISVFNGAERAYL